MARVSARVSDDARSGWERATIANGCTFSALVEALGLAFEDRSLELPEDVAERARRIDRERFSRRFPSPLPAMMPPWTTASGLRLRSNAARG